MGSDLAKNAGAGVIAGAVSALPGASGSTMLVIFGLYERYVSALTGPRSIIREYRFLLVVMAGILAGVFLCTLVLDSVMDLWEMPLLLFFAVLILFQLPEIKKMEGRKGLPDARWISMFCAGFFFILAILFMRLGHSAEPSFLTMIIVGMLFAAAKLLPGISGSTLLVALGLYDSFVDAVSDLNLGYLLPMLIGALASVFALSNIMKKSFERYRNGTFGLITGLTVGSLAAVCFDAYSLFDGTGDIPAAAAGIAAGAVAGILLRKAAGYLRADSA